MAHVYDFTAVVTTMPLSAESIHTLQQLTSKLWGRPLVVLSVCQPPSPASSPPPPPEGTRDAAFERPHIMRGVRVLYVEDSKLCQRMVTQLLSQYGVQCKTVRKRVAVKSSPFVSPTYEGLGREGPGRAERKSRSRETALTVASRCKETVI
jgi:hypothetical protein